MERLTIPDVRVDEHTTRRTMIDVRAVKNHAMDFYWRLKAYEDTRLEPEEVLPKDKADEIALKLMRLADLESLCSYTRLRELAEADKDGRVVVLPCKVGDTVYILRRTFDGADVVGKTELWWTDIPQLGKTVFLTREEAEKALEAIKDE